MKKSASQDVRIENIYRLEGRVPIAKAIPFGLQHVLAMFVAALIMELCLPKDPARYEARQEDIKP